MRARVGQDFKKTRDKISLIAVPTSVSKYTDNIMTTFDAIYAYMFARGIYRRISPNRDSMCVHLYAINYIIFSVVGNLKTDCIKKKIMINNRFSELINLNVFVSCIVFRNSETLMPPEK